MDTQQLKVHCIFQDGEKSMVEILLESFLLYLIRIFVGQEEGVM